ncbi:hypothetical protein D3C72_2553460 [compost metagenome]
MMMYPLEPTSYALWARERVGCYNVVNPSVVITKALPFTQILMTVTMKIGIFPMTNIGTY